MRSPSDASEASAAGLREPVYVGTYTYICIRIYIYVALWGFGHDVGDHRVDDIGAYFGRVSDAIDLSMIIYE